MSLGKVLATVNGKKVTQADMEMLVHTLGPQKAAQFNSAEGQNQLLDELVNQELFHSDAMDQNYNDEEEYKVEVEKAADQILKQFAIRKLLMEAKVDDSELKEFYEANKVHYKQAESIQASHILIDTLEEAKNILLEITDGATFEEAATKYSKCPSKERGGDLGMFGKGQMVPEFEKRAFELAVDEISEPVQTQFGYHIIKPTAKVEESEKTFEEVEEQLRNELLVKAQNTLYLDKVNELKEKYTVEIAE